jgi:secreted trypsin-like serine protease
VRRLGTCALLALGLAGATLAPPAHAIVGGFQTKTPWPAFASLVLDGDHQCGASLIRPQWIVTGAHCVANHTPDQYTVIVGPTTRNLGPQIPVKSITVHPGYAQETIPVLKAAWDVAVVELARPVDATPIRIPAPGEEDLYKAGTPAVSIGFGDPDAAGTTRREQLWEVDFPIVSDADCGLQYAGRFDAEQHICAGKGDGQGDCNGDSGGPLMVRDRTGAWVLVGDVSFGIGCATPGTYDVFARVVSAPLHKWIDDHLPPLEPPRAGLVPGPASPPAAAPSPPATLAPSPSPPQAARKPPKKASSRKRACARKRTRKARSRCRRAAARHRAR